MKPEQLNIFATSRMQMTESIQLTIESLLTYGPLYDDWCMAWSGGKDSSTLITLVVYLISSRKIPAPKSLTIYYSDTRQELTPLQMAVAAITEELKEHGYPVHIVMAPMNKRFLPYILGRGVPPPSNRFRWCTGALKVEPMEEAIVKLHAEKGKKVLMLTGVRLGESAARDGRIIASCSKDGAECGQGWFQTSMPEAICDTLAPILHWRVCHVWEWLKHWAPLPEYGDFSTEIIADAYGGDEAEEHNARTGCIACPLVEKDYALDILLRNAKWQYLQPLKELKPLYRWMREPANRLRKTGLDEGGKNKQRMGPLTFEARRTAFDKIMDIQQRINSQAGKMPQVILIDNEEAAFIQQQWQDEVWPDGWEGDEPTGDVIMDKIFSNGTRWPDLFGK